MFTYLNNEKQDGAFFPAEATLFNDIGSDTNTWDSKDVHVQKEINPNVEFSPTDFRPEFPPDVHVSDHRNKS